MKGRVLGPTGDGEILIEAEDGTIYAVPIEGLTIEGVEVDASVTLPEGVRLSPLMVVEREK